MKFNVHAGHNPDGKTACGAVGLIKESTQARLVKAKVITYLKAQGHTVYDCTCENGTSQSDVLKKIIKKCNANKVAVDVSIHFNSGASDEKGNGKTTGVEVLVHPNSTVTNYATNICKAIADLGFKNRGVKTRNNLYFLNQSKNPALLIECCFVDDKDDVALYSAEAMAKAIVKGLTGKEVTEKKTTTNTSSATKSTSTTTNYKVKITTTELNVRKSASASSDIVTTVKKDDVYTIVEEKKNGETTWGKLKSGVGWISLQHTKKV
jgi:N-acetylmuramoyl-L-alanine amidase